MCLVLEKDDIDYRLGDLIVMCSIIMKFRTAFEAPCSRVFKRRRLIENPSDIASMYLRSDFILDLIAALPLPQCQQIIDYIFLSFCQLPKFAPDMATSLLEAICQHLKTLSCKEGTYIVKQMLFIFSGELELSFTHTGNSCLTILGSSGECCGQEIVTWASQSTTSMDNLPSSTWTIKCLTDVEAFVLQAYDMKILATQFAHNQEFQRAFKQHYP
ncbi:probable cyclic nucleotide-gated ion channel 14 [Chenopodium quinoa]|uniref:probable cyclic nucleotide-gated ion channel 14 n=1 Tax=Chenopodium quinoa TaxID=63459 RepID=UPI000B782F47|nr:probable cyclic nucleotide-gated ion channel 14 [Chenopodium quinoa]